VVVTILDGEVTENNWQALKDAYTEETANIPDGIHQTFLIQSQNQPTLWRIMTHWRSQDDLGHMRQTEKIPPAVRIFQAAEAKPSLGIWRVEMHRFNKNSTLQ
jgi:quinol monooxygenase YgiN